MKEYRYEINGKKFRVRVKEIVGDSAVVEVNDRIHQVTIKRATVPDRAPAPAAPQAPASAPAAPKPAAPAGKGAITAPMPGVVLKILVDRGDMVNAGDVVLVIEAMKMENEIKAAFSGTVKKVMVETGDSVNTGDQLILFDA